MAKHDIPDRSDQASEWDDDPRWDAAMSKMMRLERDMPDEHWCVGAAQNMAHLLVDLEAADVLTLEQRAMLYPRRGPRRPDRSLG
jgi:hypothetical protein